MLFPCPVACILLALLSTTAHSRSFHRHRHLHRQNARQRSRPIFTTLSPASNPANDISRVSCGRVVPFDGGALAHDIKVVEEGLAHLSEDLSKFLSAVQGFESLLTSHVAISADGEHVTDITPIVAPSSAITTADQDQGPETSSITCYEPGPVGGPVPCPTTTSTPLTTFSVQTVPRSAPYGYYNQTSGGYGPVPTPSSYARPTTTAKTITLQHAPPRSSTTSSTSAFYTFNPQATDNVAVYYGQTPSTNAGGLLPICQDVNVDLVILAFVYDFFGSGGYPSAEFGPACWASTNPQAPGLANCALLAPEIAACQRIGKKVLVSVGGAVGNSSLGSDIQAKAFASMLWNLFGAGTNESELRPFGPKVVVDGFDIDNENGNPAFYDTFAAALREHFAEDPGKTYYLSAAPQCPIPDASIPMGLMYESDFIWVQFYNNPPCNLGTSGFPSSFAAWSQNLTAGSGTPGRPRLYIGAPGASNGIGSGYVPGSNLSFIVDQVLALNVSDMGGIMLWDGTEAMENVDNATGASYLQYAKSALQI